MMCAEGDGKIIDHTVKSKFSKFTESNFDELRLEIVKPVTNQKEIVSVTSRTKFFEKFRDTKVVHFYKCPAYLDSNNL